MQITTHVTRWSPNALRNLVLLMAGALGFFAFVRFMDSRWAYIPYVFSVTLALAALTYFVSRRPIFSLSAAFAFSVLQALASQAKYKLNGMALHVYDIWFTAQDGSLLGFLLENYRRVALMGVIALVVAGLLLAWLYRRERPVGMNGWLRTSVLSLAISLCFSSFPRAKTYDSDYLPFTAGYNAAALYFSLSHLPYLVEPSPIAARLANTKPDVPLAAGVDCGRPEDRSDFVLALAESQSPLALANALSARRAASTPDIAPLFASGDGRPRALHVETFGAGTWMTNFSVLTGLSTADFGWQAPYVNTLMQDKIRGALPDVMARCGYRTIALMSLNYNAVNEGPFLKSLGFGEVYDARAMGLGTFGVRDSAYYDFVGRLIARHRQSDPRPLFIAMQTMFTHGPYTVTTTRTDDAGEAALAGSGEVEEYARRVLASRKDFAHFLAQRRADPGPRGVVVAEFGDHQATATRPFIDEGLPGRDDATNFASAIYQTFYSVHGFGTVVDYARLPQAVDAGFLSARILQAAHLPTSPAWRDLARLSDVCAGRLHLCGARAEIDKHLKARNRAGLLVIE